MLVDYQNSKLDKLVQTYYLVSTTFRGTRDISRNILDPEKWELWLLKGMLNEFSDILLTVMSRFQTSGRSSIVFSLFLCDEARKVVVNERESGFSNFVSPGGSLSFCLIFKLMR